ncbi:MAG: DUF3795 domain-containing protein [bacterium]
MDREEQKLIGACGLDCYLCPRFHTKDRNKCPGCKLIETNTWCGIFQCCVLQKYLVTCADCEEYPCERLLPLPGQRFHKLRRPNLDRIKEIGIEFMLKEQKGKHSLLKYLLDNYDDGYSINFYCLVCNFMPVSLIEDAISEVKKMIANHQIDSSDLRLKIATLKSVIKRNSDYLPR